jgi:hypothetical protein
MRMAILNPSLLRLDERLKLSLEEVKAVAAYFEKNVPQIMELVGNDVNAIEDLVKQSTVVELKKTVKNTSAKLLPENLLYKRGKISNTCILVLAGKVQVVVGKDGFLSEIGPWMTLGQNALISKNDEYVPDFSAYIESPNLRFLRISKPTLGERKAKNKTKLIGHGINNLLTPGVNNNSLNNSPTFNGFDTMNSASFNSMSLTGYNYFTNHMSTSSNSYQSVVSPHLTPVDKLNLNRLVDHNWYDFNCYSNQHTFY